MVDYLLYVIVPVFTRNQARNDVLRGALLPPLLHIHRRQSRSHAAVETLSLAQQCERLSTLGALQRNNATMKRLHER